MDNKKDVAVSFRGISKTFGDVYANRNVSFDVYKGEILSLLGENGSGKTTLMNMLSGIYYPDEGHILIDSKEVVISSPKDSFDLHIGMVHQHFKLVDVLTTTENIVLGLPGKLNIKDAKKKIKDICDKYGFDVDPDKKIYDMSVSEKQTVEIIKVLYRGANILVLDEPTAVLTPQETEKLFNVMRNMKADGKSIIIITHKLHEVKAISDRVAILRKGEFIGDMITAESDEQQMTDMMVGRSVTLNIERKDPVIKKSGVVVENLSVKDADGVFKVKDVSFTARGGEVLGIAGISGCGQKELLEAIAGLAKVESGSIRYFDDEKDITVNLVDKDPALVKDLGISISLAFVPEDRLGMGLVANMSVAENMMVRSYQNGKSCFVDRKTPTELAQKIVDELEVVTPSVETPIRMLSGGNVQKVLVGREIASNPDVFLTAYAVRGLDINSSYTIYDLINKQKERGCAVIFVGEDLDVLVEISDRILILCDGEVSGIIDGRGADKNKVGLLMTKMGDDLSAKIDVDELNLKEEKLPEKVSSKSKTVKTKEGGSENE